MVSKRRTYMDIFSDILRFCSNHSTKTKILYGCNLNSSRLTLHLNALIFMGLLEKENKRIGAAQPRKIDEWNRISS